MFFGGGTPSLFAPEDFARLLEALAGADRIRGRCGDHPGGQSRHHRTRPLRRLSRRGHQSRVLGRAELSTRGARRLGPHSSRRRHASRGRGTARGGARQFQSRSDVCAAAANVRRGARPMCERLRARARAHLLLSADAGARDRVSARPPPLPDEDAAWQIQADGPASAGRRRAIAQYEVSAYAQAKARAAGTTSTIGCSATMWASVRAPTASSASKCRTRSCDRRAQAAARLSGAVARARWARRRRCRPASEVHAAADLPFEFMMNALRLNEGFADAISSGAPAFRRAR